MHNWFRRLSHCRMDRHYLPFISRCAYCSVPYAVISKAETFEEDKQFIGVMAGIQFEDIQEHKSSGGGTKELARKYFEQLDRKTVDQLFEFYKVKSTFNFTFSKTWIAITIFHSKLLRLLSVLFGIINF